LVEIGGKIHQDRLSNGRTRSCDSVESRLFFCVLFSWVMHGAALGGCDSFNNLSIPTCANSAGASLKALLDDPLLLCGCRNPKLIVNLGVPFPNPPGTLRGYG